LNKKAEDKIGDILFKENKKEVKEKVNVVVKEKSFSKDNIPEEQNYDFKEEILNSSKTKHIDNVVEEVMEEKFGDQHHHEILKIAEDIHDDKGKTKFEENKKDKIDNIIEEKNIGNEHIKVNKNENHFHKNDHKIDEEIHKEVKQDKIKETHTGEKPEEMKKHCLRKKQKLERKTQCLMNLEKKLL